MPARGAPRAPRAPGLVAAYSFNEGSGTTALDVSGNGHPGTLVGATWTTSGRYGGALSFDGTSGRVDLGSLGTFYQSGFTLEAWVKKATDTKKDVAVVGTWTGPAAGPMIWVDHVEGRYRLTTGQGLESYLDSGETPVAATWQHLAATFDGSVARFYIDGTEVADRTISGGLGSGNTWRVGAYDGTPTGFFDGVIDEIRIYSRALSAAEIVTDRDEALADPDTTPPSAPGTLTATGGSAQASLTWGAATDAVGVARYNVHRSTTAGFTPDASNRVAQPTDTSYLDSPLAAGTYYYRVTAQDAAGNVGPPSNQASATVTGDTTPPQVSITSPAAGTVSGPISVTANASDNLAVAGVQFKRDGQNLGAEDTTAPYSVPWDTRNELNGTHVLTAVARDTLGNTATSSPVTVTVSNTGVSTVGLRAAYGLDEGAGTTAADSSGNHKTATLAGGAGWSTAGRYGGAVTLNGTTSEVDPPALGTFYKTAFTLEAWVLKQSTKVDVGVVGAVGRRSGRRRDDLGRPRRRAVPPRARDELLELRRLRAAPRPSASGSTSRRRTTARRPASTSTASRPPRPRTQGTSATRTPGGSAHTARPRPASSTVTWTTSASTTARSRRARSRPTPHPGSSPTARRPR